MIKKIFLFFVLISTMMLAQQTQHLISDDEEIVNYIKDSVKEFNYLTFNNYINRIVIEREHSDNKDKHKIKWKEIEKNNNHYVICFINGFETVIVGHDMINGIPYPILVEDYSKGTEILIQCKILTRTSFVVDYVEINGKSYEVDSFMEKLYKNYRK